jgi:hypothetical protein
MIELSGMHLVPLEVPRERREVVDAWSFGPGPVEEVVRGVEPFRVAWAGGALPRRTPIDAVQGQLRPQQVYLAVPVPQTTAEHLAAAVLMKEPVAMRLVDCLLESGAVDVNEEVERKIRRKALDEAVDLVKLASLTHGAETRQALEKVRYAIGQLK